MATETVAQVIDTPETPICWYCEAKPAVMNKYIPKGKWGFVPVALCQECSNEIG